MRKFSSVLRLFGTVPLLACLAGACSYLPDVREAKLPQMSTFIPTSANDFNRASIDTQRPVTAADLVDAQGLCPGVAPTRTDSDAAPVDRPIRGVSLDMTECEVATALGPPQSIDVGSGSRGRRKVVMTYTSGDRPGIYRFANGRLAAIERGAEPPPPPEAKRSPSKPPKKQAKQPPPAPIATVQ